MSHLALYLFGGFRAELNGNPLSTFGTNKNRALLVYLALESQRPRRREELANLLWPNRADSIARNSLRQALYQLRRIIVEESDGEPHLLITPSEVQFNRDSDHWIDFTAFKRLLTACHAHHPAGLSLCARCVERVQRAVELYQGEMLQAFTLPDCAQFTEWQVISQEACHNQALAALSLLADYFEINREYDQLIACTQRKIELEPWREVAYRRQMWALAMKGERERALQQYETLRDVLQRELGISPVCETLQLYEQIRDSDLFSQHARQAERWWHFAPAGQPPAKANVVPFVGRQRALAQLERYLKGSLAGQGRVAVVRGEAGSGKTALLNAFARHAMGEDADLLVVGGTCNSYCGQGDSYQPFREVLGTLTGTPSALSVADAISPEHAWRLQSARPILLQIMHDTSPGLAGRESAPGRRTTSRPHAEMAYPLPESPFWQQTGLCNELTRLLLAISCRFPLLILLDDLQWLDGASASLLFHLGCHLAGGRILLLGAYRPEDVALAKVVTRHPLVGLLHEFQRRFGEMGVDLSGADGRAFVDAYLDGEPNRFDRDFREMLYRHTGGNALYTVELLHAMQARGEVVQDSAGYWVQESPMDWERLPARVEAVIAEQIGRLDRECRTLLEASSVQGEVFAAGVLAEVFGADEKEIISRLRRQRLLVSALDPAEKSGDQRAGYRFRCLLFQKYLYQKLDHAERQRLERATAEAAC